MNQACRNFLWVTRGLLLVVSMACAAQLQAASQPVLGDEALAKYRSLSLDQTFAAIATGIRYEPYAGVLRGPRATALARGGNAADQAQLLAELLREKGFRIRFVQGTLQGENLRILIRGIYPPDLPALDAPAQFGPFDPQTDSALQHIAAAHVWLEVDQGDGSWLPLDPAFPRAQIGESYAQATTRSAELPDSLCQRLLITLNEQTAAGSTRELGRVEGCVADLGLRPLSLRILGFPQLRAPEGSRPKAGPASMFGGALSGDAPQAEEQPPAASATPETVGVVYRRSLRRDAENIPVSPSLVETEKSGSAILREWLRIEIKAPASAPRVIERDVYAADAPGAIATGPGFFRRYSLVVMPGPLDPGAVASYLSKTGKSVDLGAAQSKIAASQSSNDAKTIEDIAALDDQVGSLSGHWLGLALGAEISELTERIAFSNAVTYAQSLPRIVIVSLETEPGNPAAYRSAVDLRLDEVDAWPYPGQATRAAQHFQSARGLQNSMLEARFLERALGLGESANTMNLVARAEGGQSGMLFFGPGQRADLNQVDGLSAYARRLIEQSLKAGREIVLPAQPVQLAGRSRFGWWEHDPSTGRVVGVMDDGLHQATVGYSINTTKIGMNDDTGLVIGAMVGATTTEILIAAKILETGSMTPALVADIEKRIKSLLCMSCPEASSKGTIGVTVGTSCWKLEAKLDAGVGVKTTSFCEKYSAGFSCASSMILNGYKKAALTPKVEFKADWETKMPCE